LDFPDPLRWIRLGQEKAKDGRLSEEDLAIPTMPGLLNLAGVREVRGPYKLRWTCCGLYEVLVNGGGNLAEMPREPALDFAVNYESYTAGRGVEALLEDGPPFNPLAWEPQVFVDHSEVGLCFTLEDRSLCLPKALPWSSAQQVSRLEPKPLGQEKLKVGFLELDHNGTLESLGRGLRAWVGKEVSAAVSEAGATLILKEDVVNMRTGLFDVMASVLYPLRFVSFRLRPGSSLTTNVLTLKGPTAVSIVSPNPFKALIKDGSLTIEAPRGSLLYVVEGGEVQAFRTLLEAIIKWGGRSKMRLGSVMPGPAAVLADSVRPESAGTADLNLLVLNPTGYDGEPEIRLNLPVERAEFCSHLGCLEVPGDKKGILRVPAPSGCYCFAKLKIKRASKP